MRQKQENTPPDNTIITNYQFNELPPETFELFMSKIKFGEKTIKQIQDALDRNFGQGFFRFGIDYEAGSNRHGRDKMGHVRYKIEMTGKQIEGSIINEHSLIKYFPPTAIVSKDSYSVVIRQDAIATFMANNLACLEPPLSEIELGKAASILADRTLYKYEKPINFIRPIPGANTQSVYAVHQNRTGNNFVYINVGGAMMANDRLEIFTATELRQMINDKLKDKKEDKLSSLNIANQFNTLPSNNLGPAAAAISGLAPFVSSTTISNGASSGGYPGTFFNQATHTTPFIPSNQLIPINPSPLPSLPSSSVSNVGGYSGKMFDTPAKGELISPEGKLIRVSSSIPNIIVFTNQNTSFNDAKKFALACQQDSRLEYASMINSRELKNRAGQSIDKNLIGKSCVCLSDNQLSVIKSSLLANEERYKSLISVEILESFFQPNFLKGMV